MASVATTSRFVDTELIEVDGLAVYGLWVRPDVINRDNLNEEDIITLSIDGSLAGRPDLIAQEQYGTPYLEWVVIMFNNPQNPLGWPKTGSVIQIPSKSAVRKLV